MSTPFWRRRWWRRMMWLAAIVGVWALALAGRERRRIRLEAELWAAATDPLDPP